MRLVIILTMLIAIIAAMHAPTPMPVKIIVIGFALLVITANAKEL